MEKPRVEDRLREYGFDDFRWLSGKDIVVNQWVRFKCQLMCQRYGESAVCPPSLPSIAACREFFAEYESAVVLRKQKTAEHREPDSVLFREIDDNLLALERAVFLDGYYKAMALPMTVCYLCRECTGDRTTCRHKDKARPNPEALGVDVFATVRALGYPVEVLNDYGETMNRYALLLVE